MKRFLWLCVVGLVAVCNRCQAQPTGSSWIGGRPDATIDLTRDEGVALVNSQWKFAEAKIVDIESRLAGADLKTTGPVTRTYDIEPKAGAADFDDRAWEAIGPPQPDDRKGGAKLSMVWFRLNVTLPERVGNLDVNGTNVVFETVVDDYAEIWVDGKLDSEIFGQSGGSFVRGWNAPNRVVVARNAQPGQKIQLAILAINGPISAPPSNFVWFRSATLDFYKPVTNSQSSKLQIDRIDPAINEIVSSDTTVEKIASGFAFTEGPVWTAGSNGEAGYLLFSDPNENTIYRLNGDGELFEFRPKSGYTGFDIGRYRQPGSNGLARDREGRLTICEHGNRRITRIEKNGLVTVIADRFEGKRLNSPNDLVYRSDGALFFTDPPFGLPEFGDDPSKELPFSGVYCWKDGRLAVLSRELSGPNGLAFSPDEKYLYVGNWDDHNKVVMRYEIDSQGNTANGKVFFDMTSATGEDAIDGIKVDARGNLFVSGPGGLWVLSSEGRHLGTIRPPEHPHNLAFGGDDGRTLFMTCQTGVYRIRTKVPGATFAMQKTQTFDKGAKQ
ncbi:MAG: SMP-30/gluconolactonase/LRE family protein [Pirellulaceae bacterium]